MYDICKDAAHTLIGKQNWLDGVHYSGKVYCETCGAVKVYQKSFATSPRMVVKYWKRVEGIWEEIEKGD